MVVIFKEARTEDALVKEASLGANNVKPIVFERSISKLVDEFPLIVVLFEALVADEFDDGKVALDRRAVSSVRF